MEILLLFLLFQIKHFWADFVIQTYMQTIKKGVWLHPCGLSHSIDHVWSTLLILIIFNFFVALSALSIITVGIIEGVIHYLIDFTKVKYGSKDITKPVFWSQFGLDQLAHQLTYIGIVFYLLLV